jgi:two-component system, LytTR family, sensor kinase
MQPAPSARSRVLAWTAVAIAGATAIGLIFAAQDYAWRRLENVPVNGWRILRIRLLSWYAWLLILPLLLAVARRWPIIGRAGWRRVPIWIGAGLAAGAVHSAIFITVAHHARWLTPPAPPQKPNVWFGIAIETIAGLAANMLLFLLFAAAYHAVLYARAVRERETRATRLETQLSKAELQVLKMQLHPHFLFNTMQTISALMDVSVHDARRTLTRLGDLLRLSLASMGEQEVTLRQELEFLEPYLDIQRTRFQDRLTIVTDASEDTLDARVPSLILQPLVENAIRHGIEPRPASGRIEISAERVDGRLRLCVADDGVGLTTRATRPGLGIANSQERLRALYGSDQRLELRAGRTGGTEAVVEIPFRYERLDDVTT